MKTERNSMGIELTPVLQIGNTVVCEVDPKAGGGGSGKVKGGVINLKKRDSYQLEFEIKDGNPPNLKFAPAGDDAFWCGTGTCPTSKGNGSGGVLYNPTVTASGSKLTVDVDSSPSSGIYFYRLNFDNGGNFDPIIIHD